MTYEADADGVLEIVAAEGDTLPIGEVIARLGEGEGAASAAQREPSMAAPPPAAPAEPPSAIGSPVASDSDAEGAGAGVATQRIKASPVARRLAKERGVDLGKVQGTGPGGRIVRADVEGAETLGRSEGADAAGVPDLTTAKGDVTIQELTKTQQVIARRMAESKATVPEFTLTTDVDMEAAADMRRQLKAMERDGGVPSYNDMVVKACGMALREHPRANGSYRDGRFELHSRVNVGIAVAADDSLVVPTVFDADVKALEAIARETRTLAERVRQGTITPPELSGATFTVSNLGMFGVTSFTAVISPPQAAILAVGAVAPRAVAHDGAVTARVTMSVTLACDHRILYGAPAAQFLARVRELLERPLELVLYG
jgi:pyruvate dehydrogenase E2 component (dihydrolipoamide acetyltransferase)